MVIFSQYHKKRILNRGTEEQKEPGSLVEKELTDVQFGDAIARINSIF